MEFPECKDLKARFDSCSEVRFPLNLYINSPPPPELLTFPIIHILILFSDSPGLQARKKVIWDNLLRGSVFSLFNTTTPYSGYITLFAPSHRYPHRM